MGDVMVPVLLHTGCHTTPQPPLLQTVASSLGLPRLHGLGLGHHAQWRPPGLDSVRCRRWSLWRHFADFFPITIVKTAELDPSCNYLMCSHPHGVLCTGAVAVFATEGAGFKETFPGIEPHLLTLEAQFKLPLHRELILSLGACAASKRGIGSLLQREKGVAAVLVPGGARESMNGEKDRITLVLNR